jgi:hypothetical protein
MKEDSTTLASFGYTLGPTGNRTVLSENINGTPPRTYNWAYDYLYRITGETFGGPSYPSPQPVITYGFDAVGNRTSRTSTVSGINSQPTSFTPNDWLVSDAYDNNGNTTGSAAITYQ